ncbi:unnamed protein product [Trichobilharzia szidati]|nr:unnamed protein product [Trichobilharzia szidati]
MSSVAHLFYVQILIFLSIFQCYFVNSTIYSYPLQTFGRIGLSGASKQSFLGSWNSKYAEKHDDYSKGNYMNNDLLFNDHDSSSLSPTSSSSSSLLPFMPSSDLSSSSLMSSSAPPLTSSSLLFDDNTLGSHDAYSPIMDTLDPTNYYADWHRLLNGYGSQRCYPIPKNMSLCQNIGYDVMVLPNYLQHEDLKEAVEQSQVWMSLAQTECHPDLRKFLCALYAPVCVEGHQERLIHPCQNLCEDVRRNCLPKMLQFGFGWPDIVKCSRFPNSATRMCVPLSQQRRLRCSGCVEEPTFESAISSFCMADVVLRAQILYINRQNTSNSKSIQLFLDRQARTLKLPRERINYGHLKIIVDCECNLLSEAFHSLQNRLTKWLIMGKISPSRGILHVEYLSRISRSNLGLKRALKAMRRPASQLCKLPITEKLAPTGMKPNIPNPLHHVKSPPTRRSRLMMKQNQPTHLNNHFYSSSPTPLNKTHVRSTARVFPPSKLSNSNSREKHSGRRMLVRRSQGASNKHSESKYSKGTSHNNNLYPVRSVVLEYSKDSMHFRPLMQISKAEEKLPLESENDLFSPQTVSPWLR